MNKNFIMAVVLSIAVIAVWEIFMPKPAPQSAATTEKSVAEKAPAPVQKTVPTQATAAPAQAVVSHPEEKGKIMNELMMIDYSSKGGRFTRTTLTDEKYKTKNVDLLAAILEDGYFPAVSSVFPKEPDYKVGERTKNSVEFIYEAGGVKETKKITLRDNYLIEVEKTIANNSAATVSYVPAANIKSEYENEKIFNSYRKRFNILLEMGDGEFEEIDSRDDLLDAKALKLPVRWSGLNYGFFLLAVVNESKGALDIDGDIDQDNNRVELTASYPAKTVAPGQTVSSSFLYYFGPKELHKLEKIGYKLDDSVNFGMMSFLAKPLLWVLNVIFKFVGNYGLAIILLTVLVKLLLWPLSSASYKSMNKMKKLQPKIEELKARLKDDKETLNKETMMLYQKEGVNPLGGCLPLFIQMPVYFALYTMVNNAVELYNTPFLPFWLTDLSAKDPYFILPVGLGIFMFLQQRMMPQQSTNPQQKTMMYVMPVMFAGFMLFLPSGVNLYILANTILGVLQQLYIQKRYS